MEVGETWAYRVRDQALATPVRIDALGTKRPPRVKVTFLDDVFEGRQDWVASSRLVAPMGALERVDWDAENLAALVEQGSPDGVLASAIDHIESNYLRHRSFVHTKAVEWGLVTMTRPDLVALDAGLALADVTADAWWHDGACTVPMSTTVRIMAGLARANASTVRAYVDEQEALASHEMNVGRFGRGRDDFTSPEIVTAVYEELTGPFLATLKAWSGDDVGGDRSEVTRWKTQAWEMFGLLADVIDQLKRDGHEADAWRIHRRLYPKASRGSWRTRAEVERVKAKAREAEHREWQQHLAIERHIELARRQAANEAEVWSDRWQPPRE